MNRSIALAVTLLLCTFSASAQNLTEYKNWDESPEAYFMTAAERDQWRAIGDDTAAETFVNGFRARRGGDAFVKEVKTRVGNADKYLSIGKVKGSTTLRGKAVVLLGAPVNIAVNDRVKKGGYTPPPSSAAVTSLGVGASTRDGEGESQQVGTGEPGRNFRDFTFTFSAKENPAFKGKDYVVVIEADMATGRDKAGKGTKQKDLDAMFEAAAEASIKNE